MLILTRCTGEKIIVTTPEGVELEIAVLGVKGGQVRMGVNAPKSFAVHREEVQQRINQERTLAAAV